MNELGLNVNQSQEHPTNGCAFIFPREPQLQLFLYPTAKDEEKQCLNQPDLSNLQPKNFFFNQHYGDKEKIPEDSVCTEMAFKLNYKKDELIALSEEMGLEIPATAKVVDLKILIESSDLFRDDIEFVKKLTLITNILE
ncbi:hypothetical protein TNIN_119681 [Trichonephila inaurata madagascariensis]|uniref:Uncharacterized protein n=1 Tax=Trichonephila inaurata madagascariensis TaxID=2747483 RepID=A0A8X6YD43_9ARAC|nr:hypothetical protein TNIN_119681 [Trichonephila inaurata madagascariensis]